MWDNRDAVFKALADPSRRELLDRLRADNGQTLGQLCGRLQMTRQAVSKHLPLLEDANLVATVRRGREKLHYLNPVPIHEIAERWIGKYERHRLSALAELKRGLEAEKCKSRHSSMSSTSPARRKRCGRPSPMGRSRVGTGSAR